MHAPHTFWREQAQRPIKRGTWRKDYDVFTEGKALTCAAFGGDSDVVSHKFQHLLPYLSGRPLDWTGGVFYVAQFTGADDKVHSAEIIVAASGVQGVNDKTVAYTVATSFGAKIDNC